jgi:hypothetical protein
MTRWPAGDPLEGSADGLLGFDQLQRVGHAAIIENMRPGGRMANDVCAHWIKALNRLVVAGQTLVTRASASMNKAVISLTAAGATTDHSADDDFWHRIATLHQTV